MGSSRLQQAGDILGVAVPFFFEGAGGEPYRPDGSAQSPTYVNEFVTSYDGLRLAKALPAEIPEKSSQLPSHKDTRRR